VLGLLYSRSQLIRQIRQQLLTGGQSIPECIHHVQVIAVFVRSRCVRLRRWCGQSMRFPFNEKQQCNTCAQGE